MNTIKVYGPGCANCKRLEALCNEVIRELHIEANVEKITDLQAIMKAGILSTPGLEINGKMVAAGKIPTKWTLTNWIRENIH